MRVRFYGYTGASNDPPPWNNFWKQTGSVLFGNQRVAFFDIVHSLNDRYEVMAYAAQYYTTALGATPSVGHVATNVNLLTLWPSPDPVGNNSASHFYHIAEFRRRQCMGMEIPDHVVVFQNARSHLALLKRSITFQQGKIGFVEL